MLALRRLLTRLSSRRAPAGAGHLSRRGLREADSPAFLTWAGPGPGDRNYANATRANCLVFTSVREDTLNVDFYRHGGVVVDLGVVRR